MFSKGVVSKLNVRQCNPGVLMVAHGLDLSDESGYSYNLYYWEALTGAKSLHRLYCITA